MKRYREEFKEKQGGVIGITLNMDWRPGGGKKMETKVRVTLRNTRKKGHFLIIGVFLLYTHFYTFLTSLLGDNLFPIQSRFKKYFFSLKSEVGQFTFW